MSPNPGYLDNASDWWPMPKREDQCTGYVGDAGASAYRCELPKDHEGRHRLRWYLARPVAESENPMADLRARFRAEAPWLLKDSGKIRRVIFRLLDEAER